MSSSESVDHSPSHPTMFSLSHVSGGIFYTVTCNPYVRCQIPSQWITHLLNLRCGIFDTVTCNPYVRCQVPCQRITHLVTLRCSPCHISVSADHPPSPPTMFSLSHVSGGIFYTVTCNPYVRRQVPSQWITHLVTLRFSPCHIYLQSIREMSSSESVDHSPSHPTIFSLSHVSGGIFYTVTCNPYVRRQVPSQWITHLVTLRFSPCHMSVAEYFIQLLAIHTSDVKFRVSGSLT
ncbi:hypothetical protein J6590_024223 [Homalodisca vitripennis]|nr:hypothetical protein J6590_024223 [Homalodisca vitripennis]